MPASGGPGYRYGSVDPVHREGDDPSGVGPESEFGELEEIADLGRESELRVFADGFLHFGLLGVQPELLVGKLGFQFLDGRLVAVELVWLRTLFAQSSDVPLQAIEDVLVVVELVLFGLKVLFLEELFENLRLVIHRRDGGATVVPGDSPTTVVYAEVEKGEAGISTHFAGHNLIE